MVNYYQILGVSESASADEIKAAFKQKAVECHPDKHQGDTEMEEMFKQVNQAYQTLSNPYSKANYDLKLKYGNIQTEYDQPNPYDWQSARPRPRPARYTYTPKWTSKENLTATMYAFLFAFAVALIMKTGMWINDYYKDQEMQELLSKRRELYTQAKNAYDNGKYRKSLDLLVGLGSFYSSEFDMRTYKDEMIYNLKDRGDDALDRGDFRAALDFYHVIEGFPASETMAFLKKKARAYVGVGNNQKAVEIYQQLYSSGYQTTNFYYEMGYLYEVGLQDYEQAKTYYEIGARQASNDYEVTIGKAYSIVINASMVPRRHYEIYMKLAQMYIKTQEYQNAVNSVQWTKEIWPDSLINYEVEAKGYRGLGDMSKYRQVLQQARQIDPQFTISDDD